MKILLSFLTLVSTHLTTALYTNNLNYRSPSTSPTHTFLGISLPHIHKRSPLTSSNHSTWDPATLHFTHGVASGDPWPESVILWTRVAPSMETEASNITVTGVAPLYDHGNEAWVAVSTAPVCVQYAVSSTEEGLDDTGSLVDEGVVWTSSDVDYTVKVEAKNLQPYTTYYYRFHVCDSDNYSPVGRTKTIPDPDDEDVSDVKIAVYSCANWVYGYFNGYGNTARKDSVDYILHLGDYIYEDADEFGWGDFINRKPQPNHEIYTLYDYRKRLATYRTDPDLLLSHQMFPWIQTWDDHEVGDNAWRDGSAYMNNTEESFIANGAGVTTDQRKMNAVRAFFEWVPIRQVSMDDNLRIWRNFRIGKLLDLMILDTRLYDRSITDLYYNTEYIANISNDAGRSLMGSAQENWFYRTLKESAERGATWRAVGTQVIFSRINQSMELGDDTPFNYDAWDGYQANRNRTLATLYGNDIGNNVFLAGDSHASWVSDLTWIGGDGKPYDKETGEGAIGVEFAGSSISSPGPYPSSPFISNDANNKVSEWLVTANDELHWQDNVYYGYYEMTFCKEKVDAKFFGLPTVLERNGWETSIANFTVMSGENKLQRPVAGGKVESGSLKGGEVQQTNATIDTNNGTWFTSQVPSILDVLPPEIMELIEEFMKEL